MAVVLMMRMLLMNNPWEEIRTPSHDVSARRADHTHPLDIFWARDQMGRYLFLCEFDPVTVLPERLPRLKGIDVVKTHEGNRLVLVLKERGDWEIFLSLCSDILSATRTIDRVSSVSVILRRLERWREFLKQDRPRLLTEEKIKGLVGELLFMRNHLLPKFGVIQSVQFWIGPEGNPQDFNVNDSAIEVKCQLGSTAPKIRITSAEQLCPQLPDMFLFVVTLGKTEPGTTDAICLPDLVGNIRGQLEKESQIQQLERFNDLLIEVGYVDNDDYHEFSYLLADEKMFHVKDGFPKICPEFFCEGIDRVSYDISLSACEAFREPPEWMTTL